MLRRLGIRGKVLAALGVPVLVLVLLAGLVSWQSVQQTRAAQTVTNLLGAVADAGTVGSALQTERGSSASLAAAAAAPEARTALDAARAVTTTALATLEASLAETDTATLDPAVRASVADLSRALAGLAEVRALVDTGTAPAADVVTAYGPILDATSGFPAAVATGLQDRGLAAILTASSSICGLVEQYQVEQVLGAATLDGPRTTASLLQLAALFPATQVAHDQATQAVTRLGLGLVVPLLGASDDGVSSYEIHRSMVATGDPAATSAFGSAEWVAASTAEIGALAPVVAALAAAADTAAAVSAAAALSTSLVTLGLALAAVLLSVLTALVVARQIVQPLRRLTEAVGAVRTELPRLVEAVAVPGQGPDLALVQIPVTSNDEIGRLAAAFNDVNATTIQVAQEQAALRGSIAEMFINVARRDQVLLNRQLTFIDALERSEDDPKALADLFRLDHLATRMRRNAESLLVLAGIDTGRRLRDTLALSDVIRTASSEIEHYERVMLDLPVDPMMLGHTALPAAHLLAELLENATRFSEPGTPVHVSTGIDATHVLVTVLDQGLGMTPEELAQAQAKIQSSSAGEVLGAQRLGMFVVGRIALRLNAQVELAIGPYGTGTQATVRLPLVLFTDVADLPATPPSMPAPALGSAASGRSLHSGPVSQVTPVALEHTHGGTQAGLGRRRPRAADAETAPPSTRGASSMPLAPTAESLAGAAAAAVEDWVPPQVEEVLPQVEVAAPLTRRRVAELAQLAEQAAAAREKAETALGAPQAVSSTVPSLVPDELEPELSLPTRTPHHVDEAPPLSAPSAPGPVEGRASMFSGFRVRRAEPGEPIGEAGLPESEPVGVLAGPPALAGLPVMAVPVLVEDEPWPTPEVPGAELVVPLLQEDEDDEELWMPAAGPLPQSVTPDVEPGEPATDAVAPPLPAITAELDEPWLPAVPEVIPHPWPSPAASAPDFAELVQGPDQAAPARPKLFRRRKAARASAAPPAAVAAPTLPAPAAPPVPSVLGASSVAPVRQSVWDSEPGAHAWPAHETPVAPFDAPAAVATPTYPDLHPAPDAPPAPGGPLAPVPPASVTPVGATPSVALPAAGAPVWYPHPDTGPAASGSLPSWRRPAPAAAGSDLAPLGLTIPETPVQGVDALPLFAEAVPDVVGYTPSFAVPPTAAASVPSPRPAARSMSFTPQDDGGVTGSPSHQAAQRADLAQQALAELSQLSSYRPRAQDPSAPPLVRRTPAAVPEVTPIATTRTGARPSRDADQVRSLLSSFQTGTSRGRQDAGAPNDSAAAEADAQLPSTSW